MAESKNTFLKSKMNKDLDARLIPSGEYRTGLNIAVSRSEGPDVGALENVRGNELLTKLLPTFTITVDGAPTVGSNTTSFNYISDTGRDSFAGQWDYRLAVGYRAKNANISAPSNSTFISSVSDEGTSSTELVLQGAFSSLADGDVITITPNLEIIGVLPIEKTNKIYIFATNYTDSQGGLFNTFCTTALGTSAILEYNLAIPSSSPIVLVQGSWLNFSTTNQIINSNLLEELLFWTDDRNQPRKINVSTALAFTFSSAVNYSSGNWGYYKNEDHVSVAKYAPITPVQLWKKYDDSLHPNGPSYETTMRDVVTRNLPNGGVFEVLADVTDTANEFPVRPINGYINTGVVVENETDPSSIAANTTVSFYDATAPDPVPGGNNIPNPDGLPSIKLSTSTTLTAGDKLILSVNPYVIEDYAGDPDYLEDKFVRFSYRFKYDDGEYSLGAPFTQAAFVPKQDGFFLGTEAYKGDLNIDGVPAFPTTASDEVSAYQSTIVKFMENKVNNILLRIPMPFKIDADINQSDETNFVECSNLSEDFKVTELEILYKESDDTRLQVLDTIKTKEIANAGSAKYFEYDYQARKPFKTLPESDLTRVFDKIPPRAKTQEIISNRVVYGNFVNKLTPPESIDYNVALSDKFDLSDNNINQGRTSIVEYPQHTVKHNRNYQVGIVLADRYGRASTPILSSNDTSATSGGISFGGSTFYAPYRLSEDATAQNETDVLNWPGDSIKVLFNAPITSFRSNMTENGTGSGTPGIYSYSEHESSKMNPQGWFTYKVVVKQLEQDYYNVYLPGIINGVPANDFDYLDGFDETAYLTLYSDNINKIPRDLSEVGPDQKQYRSSVRLFGRVEPAYARSANGDFVSLETASPYNRQYFPSRIGDSVTAIGQQEDMLSLVLFDQKAPIGLPGQFITEATGTVLTGGRYDNPPNASIYNGPSNPFIARLTTTQPLGQADFQSIDTNGSDIGDSRLINLGVMETDPFVSNLQIFWETSTWGFLPKLNEDILTSTNSPAGVTGFDTTIFENQVFDGAGLLTGAADSPYITTVFQVETQAGAASDLGVVSNFQVFDQTGIDRTNNFEIESGTGDESTWVPGGSPGDVGYGFRIRLNSAGSATETNLCYGQFADTEEVYTFSFDVELTTNPNETTLVQFNSRLGNIAPTITNCPITSVQLEEGATDIITLTGVNGSSNPDKNTNDLIFTFGNNTQDFSPEGEPSVVFNITAEGVLTVAQGFPTESYVLNVRLHDANRINATPTTPFLSLSVDCLVDTGFGGLQAPYFTTGYLGSYQAQETLDFCCYTNYTMGPDGNICLDPDTNPIDAVSCDGQATFRSSEQNMLGYNNGGAVQSSCLVPNLTCGSGYASGPFWSSINSRKSCEVFSTGYDGDMLTIQMSANPDAIYAEVVCTGDVGSGVGYIAAQQNSTYNTTPYAPTGGSGLEIQIKTVDVTGAGSVVEVLMINPGGDNANTGYGDTNIEVQLDNQPNYITTPATVRRVVENTSQNNYSNPEPRDPDCSGVLNPDLTSNLKDYLVTTDLIETDCAPSNYVGTYSVFERRGKFRNAFYVGLNGASFSDAGRNSGDPDQNCLNLAPTPSDCPTPFKELCENQSFVFGVDINTKFLANSWAGVQSGQGFEECLENNSYAQTGGIMYYRATGDYNPNNWVVAQDVQGTDAIYSGVWGNPVGIMMAGKTYNPNVLGNGYQTAQGANPDPVYGTFKGDIPTSIGGEYQYYNATSGVNFDTNYVLTGSVDSSNNYSLVYPDLNGTNNTVPCGGPANPDPICRSAFAGMQVKNFESNWKFKEYSKSGALLSNDPNSNFFGVVTGSGAPENSMNVLPDPRGVYADFLENAIGGPTGYSGATTSGGGTLFNFNTGTGANYLVNASRVFKFSRPGQYKFVSLRNKQTIGNPGNTETLPGLDNDTDLVPVVEGVSTPDLRNSYVEYEQDGFPSNYQGDIGANGKRISFPNRDKEDIPNAADKLTTYIQAYDGNFSQPSCNVSSPNREYKYNATGNIPDVFVGSPVSFKCVIAPATQSTGLNGNTDLLPPDINTTAGAEEVWISSWLVKYANKFFIDQELTQEWTPATGSSYYVWHAAPSFFRKNVGALRCDLDFQGSITSNDDNTTWTLTNLVTSNSDPAFKWPFDPNPLDTNVIVNTDGTTFAQSPGIPQGTTITAWTGSATPSTNDFEITFSQPVTITEGDLINISVIANEPLGGDDPEGQIAKDPKYIDYGFYLYNIGEGGNGAYKGFVNPTGVVQGKVDVGTFYGTV